MTTQEARAAVAAALATIAPDVDIADVDPTGRFRDEMDLDSMDFLAIVQALEDRTGISIPEADYEDVQTLDRLVAYLQEHAVPSVTS